MKKIQKFLKKLWQMLRLPEMLILPGNLAFFLVLSLAPIITLFGVIASSLSLSVDSIVNFLGSTIPKEVMEIIIPFFDSGLNISNFLFIIIGFFVASNGADSLITASNVLYKTKNKNYIYRRIKALFMTFWLLLLFICTLLVMAFGSFILTKLLSMGNLGRIISNNFVIITIIKIIFAFIIIFITLKVLYTLSSDKTIKSKFVNKGTMFSTITIMILTMLYSIYVNNFAHYDYVYGSLANIAILMLLIYFISYIIVLGIAINHNYYEFEMNDKKME